jgi:hypothetical protein
MVGITILDVLIGLVPLLGDLFDFAYKANKRNADLLTRHLDELEGKPMPRSWPSRMMGMCLLLIVAGLFGWVCYRLMLALGS